MLCVPQISVVANGCVCVCVCECGLQFIVCHSINNFACDLNAFLKSSINAQRRLKSAKVVSILFCALLEAQTFLDGEARGMGKGVTLDGALQRRLQLRLVAFVSQPGKVSAFHLFMFSLDQQRWGGCFVLGLLFRSSCAKCNFPLLNPVFQNMFSKCKGSQLERSKKK